ncbi:response regulator transcription factor [Cohnella herbarum]|uniref:Response regulator n=1 Tax=Cohnella herbarum TaxID=2728023 RepID=A0A7Z2VJ31_9BACL|nr:response regulator [Cohnella herbarum]QJD83890.1 response regulator [Cohnella herbarum]
MYEILIVDDHTHLVDSLAIGLPWELMGITAVHKAYSGEEALELLGYHAIDIVVTDIQMGGMSGLELISHVNEKWKNIKSVILTGHDEFQYAKEALQKHVSDYLLKPVSNDELEQTLRRLIDDMEQEGEQLINQQKISYLFRESLPKLRESLFQELLSGKNIPLSVVKDKIHLYELPFSLEEPTLLICIRVEEDYSHTDLYSVSLLEYAMFNIAEEVFSKSFHVWHCKDPYDYLIFLVQPMKNTNDTGKETAADVEILARLAQHQIKLYLKTKVSIVVSREGLFPQELTAMYHSALSTYSDFIGYQTESFLNVVQGQEFKEIRPLADLYAAPTLMQLIEVEQWGAFEEKLSRIFEELCSNGNNTNEYGFEIYVALLQAYSYFVHKKGKRMFEVFGRDIDKMLKADASWSAEPLREWAFGSFHQLKAYSDSRSDNLRLDLMERVYRFVGEHLKDVTLQSVADHVHLHPVYISNLFKQEAGENFSGYVLRLRMDKALQLLRDKDMKINQIALEVGYQKPQYFIKLFKTQFGVTPQEYKNSL